MVPLLIMNSENIENKTNLIKKQFTTVTPLSKYVAMALFVILPFVGFWMGMQYTSELNQFPPTEIVTSGSTETEIISPDVSAEKTNATTNPPQTYTPEQVTKTTPTLPTPPASPTVITAYIPEATLEWISVDTIGIYKDNAAIQQMIADGLCTSSEPDKCKLQNGVYYRNVDPTRKILVISPNIEVYTWTGSSYSLSKLINRTSSYIPYTVTMDATGAVIEIKEIYRP